VFYEGDFAKGKFHGRGYAIYSNGDSVEGTWKEGYRHSGTYLWVSGERYIGTFIDHRMQTRPGETAMKITPTNGYGVGSWEKGVMHGWGTWVWNDGYIRCNFVRGNREGYATTFFWNGCLLEATYVQDKRLGPARFWWANGDEWEGSFHEHCFARGVKTEQATGKSCEGAFEFINKDVSTWVVRFIAAQPENNAGK
jgi:hypothetical protein